MWKALTRSSGSSGTGVEFGESGTSEGKVFKIGKYIKKMEGDSIKLVPPEKATEEQINGTVVYCAHVVAPTDIGIASEDDIEVCLGIIISTTTHVSRGFKYGIGDIRFTTKQKTASYATVILKVKTWAYCLYIYINEREASVSEIELKWVAVAILSSIEEKPEIKSESNQGGDQIATCVVKGDI